MPIHKLSSWTFISAVAVLATVILLLIPIPPKEFDEKYEPVGKAAARKNLSPGRHEVLIHNRIAVQGTGAIQATEFFILGTDHEGRSFAVVLLRGVQSSVKVALLGTLAVMVLAVAFGVVQGTTRSKAVEQVLAAGSLGLLALPESAVLITLGNAWPRTAEPWRVNLSMVGVLVLFAVPTGARLIAERIRSVNRSGFVEASRGYGARYFHTFRKDVLPHLGEDLAWILATVIPRFIAVEIGLAYLGVEYREFDGLGRALKKSFDYLSVQAAVFQLIVTIVAVVWLALLPQVFSRFAHRAYESGDESEPDNTFSGTGVPVVQAANKKLEESTIIPSDILLRIRCLTVTTPEGREILRGLNFDLPRGKVVVMVGESGSGKSTLVNCILNLVPDGLNVTDGSIFYTRNESSDLLRLSEADRRLLARKAFGYVPQDARSALDPLAKASDIVREAATLAPLHTPSVSERVRAALLSAGLSEDFLVNDANRRRGRLSGGQCQRVVIAQAIVNQPDLLLMDEPTSSLDPLARKDVLSTVKGLTANGRAILLVTHDIGNVAEIADWIAVMYLGRVVESGPASQVLNAPKHPYTKALLRCIPRVDTRFPLAVISGQLTNDSILIPGCKFHPRCPECVDRCRTEEPETRIIAEKTEVACHVA